jgi:uncharacterized membrane protein HdeD (DUF308 family)
MPLILAQNWWAVALRGVLAILFGIVTFMTPGLTVASLVLLFGAYALIDGIFTIVAAVRAARADQRWGALLVEGFVGIAAGIFTFLWPGVTALTLLYVIAFWAIVTGILEIAAAIRLRKVITGELFLGLAGAASIVFGILIVMRPGAASLAIALWIGAYAIVFGIVLLVLAFRLRRWHGAVGEMARA